MRLLKYRTPDVPRQDGELGRLRILKGAEVGAIYVLKSPSVILGRGDEANIIIGDIKASRSHARLDYTVDGWVMSDLGSANGIFFQGEYIRKFNLRSGEHFTLGETVFEFLLGNENTRALTAPLKDAAELERQDMALAKKKVDLHARVKVSSAPNKKGNLRTLLLLGGVGAAYFFMFGQDPGNSAQKKSVAAKKNGAAEEEDRGLASYLPGTVNKEVEKTAEQYYWQGFREYMKGNFLRAKESFELALQVNPSHDRARHYLASVNKENADEIKSLIASAKKAKLIGHVQSAKGFCETALRHLYNDQANPDYADCAEILKEMKAGGGG